MGGPNRKSNATKKRQGLLKPATLKKQEAGIKAGKARPPEDPAQEVRCLFCLGGGICVCSMECVCAL